MLLTALVEDGAQFPAATWLITATCLREPTTSSLHRQAPAQNWYTETHLDIHTYTSKNSYRKGVKIPNTEK